MKVSGFGLVEVIIGSAILGVVLIGIIQVGTFALKAVHASSLRVQAVLLSEEGIEAVRSLRDTSWSQKINGLTNGIDYYFIFSGGAWTLTTVPQAPIDSLFDRRVVFSAVNRDGTDAITSSGGTLDPNTKLITVRVMWTNQGATATSTLAGYITNLFDN